MENFGWDQPQIEDKKWFASRYPEIANAVTGAKRNKMIALLAEGNLAESDDSVAKSRLPEEQKEFERHLFVEYVCDNFANQMATSFMHLTGDDGGRFPLTGFGRTNLFAYFAEHNLQLKRDNGAVGMVAPTGLVLDDATKRFTQEIFSQGVIRSLYHFNNTEGLFPAVAGNYSFVLLTLHNSNDNKPADCVFYATNAKHLEDKKRHLSFEPGDISLINPNTQTALLVRSEYDLELCRKLYRAAPVLVKEGSAAQQEVNPWQVKTLQMLNMTTASDCFESLSQQDAATAQERGLVPLYEGKMFWQFDHRFASFGYDDEGNLTDAANVELLQKQDCACRVTPRYWVKQTIVKARWAQKGWERPWTLAWRNIARATDERTLIVAAIPALYAFNDKSPNLMPDVSDKLVACLLATLNSLVVDFVLRLKLANVTVSIFYFKQLPILPPEAFAPADVEFIASRVAKLTRTADDINAVWLTDYPAYTFQEPKERLAIRAELDAYIAKMYGLSREELAYILDPAAVMGPDHPSVTFPGLKRKETELYGEYLTQRLVLKAYDDLTSGVLK